MTFIVTKTFRSTRRGDRWKATAYCRCGTALSLSANTEEIVDRAAGFFVAMHSGPGHGSTDAAGARRARIRAEREGNG